MTRLMIVADLHLGAGGEFGREPSGPESRLADQERSWVAACELAVARNVDAVLCLGDVWHRRTIAPREYLAFRAGLTWLAHNEIPLYAQTGNHDRGALDAPTGQHVYAGADYRLSTEPELLRVGDLLVATLPWTPPSRIVAGQDGVTFDDVTDAAAEALIDIARGLRAQVPEGERCILMAHWSVSGAVPATGADTGVFREVVLDRHALDAMGWDAVVLGHVHRPQLLDTVTPMLYPGSLATVDFGEASVGHGVVLLDVPDHGPVVTEFVPIPDRPFHTLDIDIDALPAIRFLDPVGVHGLSLAGAVVRVRYKATAEQARRVDHRAITDALYSAGAWRVYQIQAEVMKVDRARVEGVDETLTEADALDRWLATQDVPTSLVEGVRSRHDAYTEKVA